ncbi:hypothetical protein OLEAN_C35380 [Oleispira antarctica RB-8]|uniref:Uncharacterized protein n=1 Tax=Oleispira antarctica RB-8 TaxID=698738 RepID=R4YV76_OLEAN|nr:hypothetical protein OLEAN_C35380 [Oleispira antarctica RB-8]
MKQLMIALMLSIGIGSVAMSLGGDHGQRLDWDQLNLSSNQAQQVQTIRKAYQDEFQRLRKHDISKLDKKSQMLGLRDDMIANLTQVLSEDQRQQASAMMIDQAEKRINKRLDRLADKLALTPKQQDIMRSVVNTNLVENPKALLVTGAAGLDNRAYVFDQVDQIMPDILSSMQLMKWQKIKGNSMKHRTS